MKKIILFLIFSMICNYNSFSGEVTGAGKEAIGILKANGVDINNLKSEGFQVLYGELTGAGMKMNLDRVNMVLTNENMFYLKSADHIEFKFPSQANSLNDVKYFEYNGNIIESNLIKALVVK